MRPPRGPLERLVRLTGVRRGHVAAARMWSERSVLAMLPQHLAPARARILCYHSVGTPEWGVNDVSPARFRRHLERALVAGYHFVPAEAIARCGGQPGELAITFDDGLQSVATNAAPVLAELGIPWSLFVVSDWADGKHQFGPDIVLDWRQIEQLAARGVAIGSHSASHPRFAGLTPEAAADELEASRRAIGARLGVEPTSFAIPFGQSHDWTPRLTARAHAAGYASIFAQSERRRPSGTIARTFIARFDDDRRFDAALRGAFDTWEEWV